TTDVKTQADLSLTKADSPDPVVAGTQLTYTLVAHNGGPSDAQAVVVSDSLPGELADGATYSLNNGPSSAWTGSLSLGTVAAGENDTIVITATVKSSVAQGATITNDASIDSTTFDNDTSNNSAEATTAVNAVADLTIAKTALQSPA